MHGIPASDPVAPTQPPPLHHSQTWAGPMSDFTFVETPRGPPEAGKPRSGSRRSKQVQARLEQAIRAGEVPPFCENCGSIETPTWRRAWSQEVEGSEQLAKDMMKDFHMLFWECMERNAQDEVVKFKIYKKSLADEDKGWVQVLLCNPCGLWLHKFKHMRPENKWNKQPADKTGAGVKKKRSSRNRKQSGGPLSKPSTRTRSKGIPNSTAASSPAPTEASSVQADEGTTPHVENDGDQDQDDEPEEYPNKKRRANSAEPPRSTESAKTRWHEQDAMEALRRAIQSSPARNLEARIVHVSEDTTTLTPKPIRRALFPAAQNDGPLKELDASFVNSCSPRRSPRIASRGDKPPQAKENQTSTPHDDIDGLFESPSMDFDLPASPTPRRRNPRVNAAHERRHSLPCNSPTANRRKEANPTATPKQLTAERLQRVQESRENPRSTPRQHRTPNKHGIASLPDEGLHSEAFESLDGMILDIFDDAPNQPNFSDLDNGKVDDNWVDWLPSDYVSPNCSDERPGPSDDLIDAILSDPNVMKDGLHNSEFNPFDFDSTGVPDSGFFSSDALHTDPVGLASKAQPTTTQPDSQQTTSPTA